MTDKTSQTITQACLLENFEYRDGKLFRKLNPKRDGRFNRLAGTEVYGNADKDGYLQTPVLHKVKWRIHRMVYLMHHGVCPDVIDHINGDVTDNKIENLRPATVCQNSSNRRLCMRSSTGVEGVTLRKHGKYQVQLQFDNKTYYGGYYGTLEKAAEASANLRRKLRGEWQREGVCHH